MRIPRIYLPLPLASGNSVELDARALRHVVQVLRLKTGHPLILFNGEGGEYEAVLAQVEKRHARAKITAFRNTNPESELESHLAVGISKGERMDIAIQKAVELGVTRITPLYTEHCVVQLNPQRQQKRMDHWQAIIISACEQCGRNTLPVIHEPLPFPEWIKLHTAELKLILDPLAESTLAALPSTAGNVLLAVGPEGGFSQSEIAHAKNAGFLNISLGKRILRSETAVISALAAVQILWGDLG